MNILKQSEAAVVAVLLTDATGEHVTDETPTVKIAKSGGDFATITDVSFVQIQEDSTDTGWFWIDLSAAETNTVGPLILKAESVSSVPWEDKYEVVASLPADVVSHTATHPDVAITSAGVDALVTALVTADLDAETTAYLSGSGSGSSAAKTLIGVIHKINSVVTGGPSIVVYRFDGVTPLFSHSVTTEESVEAVTGQGAPS